MRKPILITGIHRSGSTFTGRMLSLNKNIAYIHEPFNPEYGLKQFDVYFKYLTKKNSNSEINNILRNLVNLERVSYEPLKVNGSNFKKVFKYILRPIIISNHQLEYNLNRLNPFIDRILIKDPIACLSSRFLHKEFDFDVVILIRHPLSFVASIKRLNWGFDFDNFLNQPELMADYLHIYKDEMLMMNNSNNSIVEIGTLVWKCIYTVLFDYIKNNPNIIAVKHEDLSLKPVEIFSKLYSEFNINFNDKNKAKIKKLTSEKNDEKAENNKPHDFKRDSKSLVKSYKKILTKEEIEYINNHTKKISSLYYD